MGKFDGILICTDLDGTLLNGKRAVSEENRNAIEYFKREGGRFTFVTGRMPYCAQNVYRLVSPNAPVGVNNGGAVYDFETKSYIWSQAIGAKAEELLDLVDTQFDRVGISLFGFDHCYFCKENTIIAWIRNAYRFPNVTCDYRNPPEPIAKVLFGIECEEDFLLLDRALRAHPRSEDFSLIRSEDTLYELLPQGIHKGVALQKIANHLNIDLKHTIAVGDYDNDVGMLRTAGVGIAVANASPSARDAADYVTVSNEEHAIARIIRDMEDGVYPL